MKAFKRCKCRDANGHELGARCPKLRRRDGSWNPNHGTWYARNELPPAPGGKRVELKAGGFITEVKLKEWFQQAELLLSIPERGPRGHEARVEILKLIKETRRKGEDLPNYDDIRTRHQRGAAFTTGLLGDDLDAWLGGKKKIRKNTVRSYESHLRVHIKPHLGHIERDKLRISDINQMFNKIDERNERIRAGRAKGRITGPATQHRILSTLANALDDLLPEGGLTFNPARHVELASAKKAKALVWTNARVTAWRARYETAVEEAHAANPNKTVDRFKIWRNPKLRPSPVMVWTPAQTGTFLDRATRHRLYGMYHLIAYRGLRRGEGCGAELEDLDLDNAELYIRSNLVQLGWAVEDSDPKTDASDAPIALDKTTVKVLRAHLAQRAQERLSWGEAWAESGKIFTRENGEALHPAWVTDQFEHLAFEADLPPIRLHDLRHGAATMGLAAGLDMKIVSAMLRHSSVTITNDLYTSVLPDVARDAAERTAAMVPRQAPSRGASNTIRAPIAPPRLRNVAPDRD